MAGRSGPDYAQRNSLIPLSALAGSDFQPSGLDVGALCEQIRQEGMKPDHFFYDPANLQVPYTYWRGPVRLDFQSLEGKLDMVKAVARRLEGEINEAVILRDFDRFLALVDPRLAPELFMEVFDFIPDHDKFRVFERLWRFNPHAHDVFPEDFARRAYQFRGVSCDLPPADGDGYVNVYACLNGGEPQQATIWTTNVNQALKAACSWPAKPVYRARVHLDGVLAYDGRWSVREVKVRPGSIDDMELLDLLDLAVYRAEMEEAGILESYRRLAKRIKRRWFHRPEGLHAVGHTSRVLMLSLLLAHLERCQPADQELLTQAAIYHDIGRDSDGYDPGHGQASYARTQREMLTRWADEGEGEIFRFIVENHDLSDSKAYQRVDRYALEDVERTLRVYQTFKDADGLDRVRLGDLNPDYLRTPSAHRLLLAAHQLYFEPHRL